MIYLKTSIGIEFRGEDMLLSSLQGNLSNGTLTHFKHIPDFRSRDTIELRQEIQLFLKANILGKDNIVLGLPRRDILLRHLDLPVGVADNLKEVIRYQVQSFEPTEEDSYYYDYALLNKPGKKKILSVLLIMVRKNLLDDYLRLLFELGVQPAVVTCSTLALTNLFQQNRKNLQDKVFVLADLAPSSMELIVLHNGIPVYSHEAPKEDSLGWKDLILKEIDAAASRMRLGADSSIEQIVLTGNDSVSAYEELKEAIPECELLKEAVPVESTEENRPFLQEAGTAVGLSFTGMTRHPSIKINLIPAAFRFKQTRWAYISAAILGLVTIAFLAGILFHGRLQERQYIKELDQEISSMKASVARVQDFRKQTEEIEKEINFIADLFREKDRNLDVIQEMTTILPADTYLNSYNYRGGIITIGGFSDSASDLIRALENSLILKDIVPKGTIRKDPRTGKDIFNIEARLEE